MMMQWYTRVMTLWSRRALYTKHWRNLFSTTATYLVLAAARW